MIIRRWLFRPNRAVLFLMSAFLAAALACVVDQPIPTPQPTPTPVDIAALTSQVREALREEIRQMVSAEVEAALANKEVIRPGLSEATNTLEPKGAIIAEESTWTADQIANIRFKLTNSAGADSVGLAASTTLVVYSDENNEVDAEYTGAAAATADIPSTSNSIGWGQRWILGAGDNVDPGEVVEFILNLQFLTANPLKANTPFKIELIPGEAAVITIERTTPLEIKTIMDLD